MNKEKKKKDVQNGVCYQLCVQDFESGKMYVYDTYRYKCEAYRARNRHMDDFPEDNCWVEQLSDGIIHKGLFDDATKEAGKNATLMECHKFLDESSKEIMSNMWYLFHDESRSKSIKQAARRCQTGVHCVLCQIPDSQVIESVYLETIHTTKRGHYSFALGIRIKDENNVAYPGAMAYTIADNVTFEAMNELTKSNLDMKEYIYILKELATILIGNGKL